ncbi:MAG: DUF3990 domain-containing protein [Bacteroidaceae bacterium]|nr:DUF3990 domain-containing protein [Bacteroidaceae bacterium]
MKLYHSSNVVVEHPDTRHSRKYLDFGCGFYLTSLYDQAVRYAQRFKRRGQQAWLNTYEFSLCDETQWNIKRFDAYDEHWLDFVAQCRDGKDVGNYDMIIGGIANDRVIITLDRYFAGEISKDEALGLLRFEKPNVQYCIRSERMLQECLTYIESELV